MIRLPLQVFQLLVCLFLCTDIDECAADTSPCPDTEICQNVPGSYQCHCAEGFTKKGTECVGQSVAHTLQHVTAIGF